MHVLGFCNGSPNGNTALLLKIALTEAQAQNPENTTISWIHTPSIIVPQNPAPLASSTHGTMKGEDHQKTKKMNEAETVIDDREAVRNAILDADAIIVATSTQSHQPPAYLKMIMDLIGGPHMDAATVRLAAEKKANGDPQYADYEYDVRLLRPKALGFLGVGGSATPDQYSQLLPSMHLWFYGLESKVVDQYVAKGFGAPGALLADPDVVERVRKLGRNVVSQMGKRFEEIEYLGSREEGACLFCHLRTFEMISAGGNEIGCITCGATGTLVVREGGRILPEWNPDTVYSCQTMVGKVKHSQDIGQFFAREGPKMVGVQEEKQQWDRVELPQMPLASNAAGR